MVEAKPTPETKPAPSGVDQPITRHPLFPAIVALWFGALFGLGSVMVSPALMERLVLATGIDKVVPMAAPPLGTTMRILLALALTGLGAVIGFVLARRFAGHAAAPQRRGDFADDADVAADEAPVIAATTGRRRRALAIAPEPAQPFEEAPIPAADPQILKVADFDLDGFEQEQQHVPLRRPQAEAPAEAEEEDNLPAWLDAESAWHEAEEPEPAIERGAFITPPGAQIFRVELDAAEQAAREETVNARPDARLFEAYSREIAPRVEDQAEPEAERPFDAPEPGFRLLPRLPQSGAVSPSDDEVEAEHEAVKAQPVARFDAPHIDARTFDAPQIEDEAANDDADFAVHAFEAPSATLEEEAAPFEAVHAEEPAPFEEPELPEFAAPVADRTFPDRTAAERIADADLDALSQVELLERLGLAMERRREDARLAAEAAAQAAAAAPFRVITPNLAPVVDAPAFEAPALAAAPFAAPAFEEPAFEDHAPDTVEAASVPQAEPQDWSRPVPAALRPVEFDALEDEHEPLDGYVPPRHIGLAPRFEPRPAPSPEDHAPGATIPFPASPFGENEEDEADHGDEAVLQQGYSSLLNLSRHAAVRRPALHFEHAEDETVEDDVADQAIYPQAVADPAPFARPTFTADIDQDETEEAAASPHRPFDAPGRSDPTDTEKALRAALATLQRMSGAA